MVRGAKKTPHVLVVLLTILSAGLTLLPVGFFAAISSGLGGQVYLRLVLLALAILFSMAWLLGRRGRMAAMFFAYGCAGGMLFVPPLFFSYGKLMQSRPRNPTAWLDDTFFMLACIAGVLAAGAVCRWLALQGYAQGLAGRRRLLHRRDRACPTCGYNLTGNVSGVCPECGTCRARNPLSARRRDEYALSGARLVPGVVSPRHTARLRRVLMHSRGVASTAPPTVVERGHGRPRAH